MTISRDTFKSSDAYVNRINDVNIDLTTLLDEKIDFILNHRATQHPFLVNYANNGLAEEDSKILYLETLHYFKYLPFYVCNISTLTRDENILRSIIFNANDELGTKISHSDMYRTFLLNKGISAGEIDNYKCLPSTQSLNDGIRALYNTLPLQKALGALFADETMSASMVSKYNDGLVKEGLSKAKRGFWILHMKVEVGHSNAIFNIMEKYLKAKEEIKYFEEGISQYLHLMEIFWDGISNKVSNNKVYDSKHT